MASVPSRVHHEDIDRVVFFFTTTTEREIVRDMKEKLPHIASDFDTFIDKQASGIHNTAFQSIKKCDVVVRKDRVDSPNSIIHHEGQGLGPLERKDPLWIDGPIPSFIFQQMWISKDDK